VGAALHQPHRVDTSAAPTNCAACGGVVGAARRQGGAVLAPCPACGSWTAQPRPTPADVVLLHDSETYFAKPYFAPRRGRTEAAEQRARRVLEVLPPRRLAGRRLLDVGCDTGDFAAAAARVANVVACGVDVSVRALDQARAHGVTTFHGELADSPFDDVALVTAIDVLEHVADPVALLRAARDRLSPDGLIYLETPNALARVYRLGRTLARVPGANRTSALQRLFPPEHLQYLTSHGLEALAARSGVRPASLFTRRLDEIAGGRALLAGLDALQVRGSEILLCAILESA
jgi:SAM-dependent methyltransferase